MSRTSADLGARRQSRRRGSGERQRNAGLDSGVGCWAYSVHVSRHTAALTIGELAKQAAVSQDTIRFYEAEGLDPRRVLWRSGRSRFSQRGARAAMRPCRWSKRIACPSCEVEVLDMKSTAVSQRAKQLGIQSVPAVVINGALADCCAGRGPTEQALRAAGIGQIGSGLERRTTGEQTADVEIDHRV